MKEFIGLLTWLEERLLALLLDADDEDLLLIDELPLEDKDREEEVPDNELIDDRSVLEVLLLMLFVEAIESSELVDAAELVEDEEEEDIMLEPVVAENSELELEHSLVDSSADEVDEAEEDEQEDDDNEGPRWWRNWWLLSVACCCWPGQPGSNLCEPMELPSLTANMLWLARLALFSAGLLS